MKTILFVLLLLATIGENAKAAAVVNQCKRMFESGKYIFSPEKNREAFLSDDMHTLKITNPKTKTEYTFESNDLLNGMFSLDGHAWIIAKYDEVQIWNFERSEGNLIHVKLKNSLEIPKLSMRKDPATGHTILKIIYRREKINVDTRRFDTVTETILKDLETFEESRI